VQRNERICSKGVEAAVTVLGAQVLAVEGSGAGPSAPSLSRVG